MENIKITIDSTCDLSANEIKGNNISVMPLVINLGDRPEEDFDDLPDKIYEFVNRTKTTPKTSARSVGEYKEFFLKHRPENGSLIHFVISADLSASYQNADLAAKEIDGVYVIDSRSVSSGAALLVVCAVKMREEGFPADEIVKEITRRTKYVHCSFIVKDLTYLHRGGRCSGTSRLFATVLMIKPQIVIKDGKLVPNKKYMGIYDHCVKKYVGDILTEYNKPDLDYCFITHTKMDNPKLIDEIREQIKAKYPFKNIIETTAGGTVTAHCGPNTLGVLYYNE